MNDKVELRKEILHRRDSITQIEREEKSHQIAQKVKGINEFTGANKILLFASYKSEVETTEIFEAAQKLGKEIFFPKVVDKEMEFYQVEKKEDLVEGYRGIFEPEVKPEKKLQLQARDKIFVLMPGAVFDEKGHRIGYGGGYYDRFLQQLETEKNAYKQQVCKVAVAFECQMVSVGQIVCEVHDRKPDYIITEETIYRILDI